MWTNNFAYSQIHVLYMAEWSDDHEMWNSQHVRNSVKRYFTPTLRIEIYSRNNFHNQSCNVRQWTSNNISDHQWPGANICATSLGSAPPYPSNQMLPPKSYCRMIVLSKQKKFSLIVNMSKITTKTPNQLAQGHLYLKYIYIYWILLMHFVNKKKDFA